MSSRKSFMKIYEERHKIYQRTKALFTYYKHIYSCKYFMSVWILSCKTLIYSSCHKHLWITSLNLWHIVAVLYSDNMTQHHWSQKTLSDTAFLSTLLSARHKSRLGAYSRWHVSIWQKAFSSTTVTQKAIQLMYEYVIISTKIPWCSYSCKVCHSLLN